MSVKIGHAGSDERGKYADGKAGDQTGREVCIREWYNRPWNVVLRPKSIYVAAGIIRSMKAACENDNIGYDQNQRTTLYIQAKAVDWDLSQITVPCETDCSALVAVCVNAAGVTVSKDIYTGNMVKTLMDTGQFDKLTSSKYLASDTYLQAGDILIYEGHHTAVALECGAEADYRLKWNYDMHGWWYADTIHSYYASCWRNINGHRYYFNQDGYAATGWQEIDGKWYYFEPREGHPLECALYTTDQNGAQAPGEIWH